MSVDEIMLNRLWIQRDDLLKENKRLEERIKRLEECIGAAWMIIANVNEGDWTKQSNYWQEFVVRWKDNDLIPVTHKAKEAKT